ncbi:MAG TPA: hypothetical protein VJL61_15240 [Rhodanobacteraceae bacterium]|nr:hypothetical protein [Rhodanobacteraceae bacterium]
MTTDGEQQTYVFLHGISVPRPVKLCDTVQLLPVTQVPDPDVALQAAQTPEDAAAFLLLLPRISSQLRIVAPDQMSLATRVWNSGWDALLLGAAFACEVGHNIESESPAEETTGQTALRTTNTHFHGIRREPVEIDENDCLWLEKHFQQARTLLDKEAFSSSMHCLASYHWHPHPRPRLSLLWSGIEGLFRIESELTFRLSLAAAKFLEPNDRDAAREIFRNIKRLYKSRSQAVHGGELKGDASVVVSESAKILQLLLRRCIETQQLPDVDELVL